MFKSIFAIALGSLMAMSTEALRVQKADHGNNSLMQVYMDQLPRTSEIRSRDCKKKSYR